MSDICTYEGVKKLWGKVTSASKGSRSSGTPAICVAIAVDSSRQSESDAGTEVVEHSAVGDAACDVVGLSVAYFES